MHYVTLRKQIFLKNTKDLNNDSHGAHVQKLLYYKVKHDTIDKYF